jgi:hypothetical protein
LKHPKIDGGKANRDGLLSTDYCLSCAEIGVSIGSNDLFNDRGGWKSFFVASFNSSGTRCGLASHPSGLDPAHCETHFVDFAGSDAEIET